MFAIKLCLSEIEGIIQYRHEHSLRLFPKYEQFCEPYYTTECSIKIVSLWDISNTWASGAFWIIMIIYHLDCSIAIIDYPKLS